MVGVIALVVGAICVLCLPAAVHAATPAPSQPGVGDPRSSGQGPGLVGDPLSAILVVAAVAILSVGATLLYIRATGGRRDAGVR
jgi:hypothetical protein